MEPVIGAKEVAELLRISEQTATRLLAAREIPAFKLRDSRWRTTRARVQEYIERGTNSRIPEGEQQTSRSPEAAAECPEVVPTEKLYARSSEAGGRMTPGDALITAIAEAVALKLTTWTGERQRILGVEQAAEYLGMSADTLNRRAGVDIPCLAGERAKRRLRFDRRDLDRWIDAQDREGM
jgi:excisionase family DNA binding protein